jgi:hypothetical protein
LIPLKEADFEDGQGLKWCFTHVRFSIFHDTFTTWMFGLEDHSMHFFQEFRNLLLPRIWWISSSMERWSEFHAYPSLI